jgi:hypothetical protein
LFEANYPDPIKASVVVHVYNHSYWRGHRLENLSQRLALDKSVRSYVKNN